MVLKLRDRILAGPGGARRPLTPAEMESLAKGVDLAALDLKAYRRFQEECYARNTVLLNEHVELVVICWLPGQHTVIHDHGVSRGVSVVVTGTLHEARYTIDHAKNGLMGTGCCDLEPGEFAVELSDTIHELGNESPYPAASLHLYSPPLVTLGAYDLHGGGRRDIAVADRPDIVVGGDPSIDASAG